MRWSVYNFICFFFDDNKYNNNILKGFWLIKFRNSLYLLKLLKTNNYYNC